MGRKQKGKTKVLGSRMALARALRVEAAAAQSGIPVSVFIATVMDTAAARVIGLSPAKLADVAAVAVEAKG
jgi:hypothetical protein